MLTHPRYGMGKRTGAADVDKWALYAIAQYCDQTVPDGFGGTEPRMTFNAYLSQQRKAWDVLSDFCSAMRCMPVWNGQTLTFVQDRPSDVVWPYTSSDVVVDDNGVGFRYSFSALKDRHTAVEVELHRPAEQLADLHGTGGRPGSHTALRTQPAEDGCVRLHQSQSGPPCRAVGDKDRTAGNADGGFHARVTGAASHPVTLLEICDNDYAGTMTGGRILSIDAASRTLTLDREGDPAGDRCRHGEPD